MDNYEFIENQQLEYTYESIIDHTVSYVRRHNLKALVLGISGGVDSALVAALAYEACRRLKGETNLIGRYLPICKDPLISPEIKRAAKVGISFCNDFQVMDLTKPYQFMKDCLIDDFDTSIYGIPKAARRAGNIQARCRMIYLFDCAAKHNGMVLSTDNYTEYLLGFWTLHGDVGNFGMIQNLWKSEVYTLTKYIASKYDGDIDKQKVLISSARALPTDGLGITSSDFDQICPDLQAELGPYFGDPHITYKMVDDRLQQHIYTNKRSTPGPDISNDTIDIHERTAFKRNNPYNIPRSILIDRKVMDKKNIVYSYHGRIVL